MIDTAATVPTDPEELEATLVWALQQGPLADRALTAVLKTFSWESNPTLACLALSEIVNLQGSAIERNEIAAAVEGYCERAARAQCKGCPVREARCAAG